MLLNPASAPRPFGKLLGSRGLTRLLFLLWCFALAMPLALGSSMHRTDTANGAIELEVPRSEADVLEAVKEVSQDRTVHGTYVYERERTLTGAHDLASSNAFGKWAAGGTVYYKEVNDVVDPRHFKGGNGLGTITVRYIVQVHGPQQTSLRIDAVFVEQGRHRASPSDGSVESAEYEAIRQRLEALQQSRQQQIDAPAPAREDEHLGSRIDTTVSQRPAELPQSDTLSQLEQQVAELRSQVEAQVKTNGVALRSAPFTRGRTIQFLPATTTVVILVLTPKWYGVETPDGHRGWIRRSELGSQP